MEKLRIYYIFSPELSSDELISMTAAHLTGESREAFRIVRGRGRKPYFDNCNLHFSVSHSGDLWVCAYALHEVGCDVQLRRAGVRFERLAERWFTTDEAEKTKSERDFYDIWSRKEAYVKLLGTGIDEKFRKYDTFSLTDAVIRDFSIPDAGEKYSCAIAYDTEFYTELFNIKNL